MSIQLLSPQLANQIAAGEVVERPSSVVKELVENSLDAGADNIQIDIEKGGSRLIRIRDNGSGIAQQELALALSRHATSKIQQLSDLEQIISLGFRGEALASISAVSRLTLTSKPANQDKGWQAKAEGRDMQVSTQPAPHPDGSTIEVLDLFFNTPARRRFLRTDKTEFAHIDDLIKKLALSRFDVSWQLSHNGQIVRQLPAVQQRAGQEKRLQQLCGKNFVSNAFYVESQYEQMRLWGWIQQPAACTSQSSVQYSYVNGRMMRDKLLNHAIRQAFGDNFPLGLQPAFVLYLELDPREVDVNVHPAKHEVRFHQARLVHDFVLSVLQNALKQLPDFSVEPAAQAATAPARAMTDYSISLDDASSNAGAVHVNSAIYASPNNASSAVRRGTASAAFAAAALSNRPYPATVGMNAAQGWPLAQAAVRMAQAAAPHQNLQSGDNNQIIGQQVNATSAVATAETFKLGMADWFVLDQQYAVVRQSSGLWLVELASTFARCWLQQPPISGALMLPLRLKLTAAELPQILPHASSLALLGFDCLLNNQVMIVRAVPQLLLQSPISQWLPLWYQQWQQQMSAELLLRQLLQLLLQQFQFPIALMQQCFVIQLQQQEHWQMVQIDLQSARQALQELQ